MLRFPTETCFDFMLLQTTFPEAVADGRIAIEGEAAKLHELLSLFDTFGPIFEIVEQKQPRAR